jgi:hypothetical protein
MGGAWSWLAGQQQAALHDCMRADEFGRAVEQVAHAQGCAVRLLYCDQLSCWQAVHKGTASRGGHQGSQAEQ